MIVSSFFNKAALVLFRFCHFIELISSYFLLFRTSLFEDFGVIYSIEEEFCFKLKEAMLWFSMVLASLNCELNMLCLLVGSPEIEQLLSETDLDCELSKSRLSEPLLRESFTSSSCGL